MRSSFPNKSCLITPTAAETQDVAIAPQTCHPFIQLQEGITFMDQPKLLSAQRKSVWIYNLYGPNEATICCTGKRVYLQKNT